jgi:methylated-DNA-[protein]-cysteine S-methyltransferase
LIELELNKGWSNPAFCFFKCPRRRLLTLAPVLTKFLNIQEESPMLSALKHLPKDTVHTTLETPVGDLFLLASAKGLHAILFEEDMKEKSCRDLFAAIKSDPKHPHLLKAAAQLKEYFTGARRAFELDLIVHGTEFQVRAWRELSKIPYGKTISYHEQARRIGDEKKARAVGTANSRNPLSIVVPCHRVIAKSGHLTGFGGGLPAKKFLLELEHAVLL